MTARLDLLAHPPTAATRAAAFPDDEPLELRAGVALDVLRGRLRGRYDSVLVAPARAAGETAEALGLAARVEPALRECDYGRWRGMALADLQTSDPAGLASWLGDPAASPHGGELLAALIERTGVWLAAERENPGFTLAITHASVLRAAVVFALGASPAAFWRVDVAPLSILRLSGRDGRWNVVSLSAFGAGEA